MSIEVDRKTFIKIFSVGGAAIALPGCNYFGAVDYDPVLAVPQTLLTIWDQETAIDIGKKYLSQFPEENNQRKLVRLLEENLTLDTNDVATALTEVIDKDFQEDRMVTVDGWVLARTEARQCALFSLEDQK